MKEIVKYDNILNQVNFRNFTENDFNLLMCLCSRLRDLGDTKQVYDYDYLMNMVGWDRSQRLETFHDEIKRMTEKLRQIGGVIDVTPDEFVCFNLFDTFRGNKQKRHLTVSVNPEFKYVLNDLTRNFTKFELEEYVGLNGRYSKQIYQHLKQFRTTGWWQISVNEIRHELSIPETMPTRNIFAKVISPSIEIIKSCKGFGDLKVEVLQSRRRGRATEGYKFTWTATKQIKGQRNVFDYEQELAQKKGKKVDFSDPNCKYECVGQETMDINEIDPDKTKAEPKRPHRKKGTTTREKIHNFEERKTDLNAIVEKRTLERMRKK